MVRKSLMALVVLMVASAAAYALPATITIDGLAGAEHWVWTEAENSVIGGKASLQYSDTTAASNWWFNPNKVISTFGGDNWRWIEFEVFLPAAMADARINFRHGVHAAASSTLLVDGDVVGTFNMTHTNYAHPFGLVPENAVAVGALSAGLHTVRLEHSGSYNERGYDGIIIYDGPNGDIINATENYGGPRYFRAPGSNDAPLLPMGVTPIVSSDGSGALQLTLNGQPYTSGTPITDLGYYELKAIKVLSAGQIVAMSGANFEVVPEPATLVLLLGGSLAALRRRRQ